MTSLPWHEVADVLIAAADGLHADALKRACELSGSMIERYRADNEAGSQGILRLEEKLAASRDERLRRIALAILISQAGANRSWSTEQRARLEIYRADTSTLVAAAAQFTVIPATEA